MAANFCIYIDALDLDKARLAITEHSAGDRALSRLRDHSDFDVGIKYARFILIGRADLNAALFGNHRSAHHIHIRIARFHDPCHNAAVERCEIHRNHRAII